MDLGCQKREGGTLYLLSPSKARGRATPPPAPTTTASVVVGTKGGGRDPRQSEAKRRLRRRRRRSQARRLSAQKNGGAKRDTARGERSPLAKQEGRRDAPLPGTPGLRRRVRGFVQSTARFGGKVRATRARLPPRRKENCPAPPPPRAYRALTSEKRLPRAICGSGALRKQGDFGARLTEAANRKPPPLRRHPGFPALIAAAGRRASKLAALRVFLVNSA